MPLEQRALCIKHEICWRKLWSLFPCTLWWHSNKNPIKAPHNWYFFSFLIGKTECYYPWYVGLLFFSCQTNNSKRLKNNNKNKEHSSVLCNNLYLAESKFKIKYIRFQMSSIVTYSRTKKWTKRDIIYCKCLS